MKKLLILSGKGGTGKTTTAASFLSFSKARAFADCDVDAPNLHLVTSFNTKPDISQFTGSKKSYVDKNICIGCGKCMEHCRFGAIELKDGQYSVNEFLCEGCGVCEYVCPVKAVSMQDDVSGELRLYKDDRVFSTAKLKMGRGNSGKLVSEVKSRLEAAKGDADFAIIDGSPGIGCPVIASVSGVDLVLIVAEPSLSGLSDLGRIAETAKMLGTPIVVSINKYDVSVENTEAVEKFCKDRGIECVGRIPYDKNAVTAANSGKSLADIDCPARDALYSCYKKIDKILNDK